MDNRPVCAIVGVGSGNGASFARKFTREGYRVAMLSRDMDYLQTLAHEIPGAKAYQYDATKTDEASAVFGKVDSEMGAIDVLVYNAGAGAFRNIDDSDEDAFQRAWEVNARGLFVAAKQVIPQMRGDKGGSIVVIGATASLRGGAGSVPFASAKAAQRSLAQSMARYLGPEKIHVSYVVVDGVIDLERTRKAMPDKSDDDFIQPDELANSVWALTQQHASAWTFEIDLRPFGEKW